MKDALKTTAEHKRTIKILVAYIRFIRAQLTENDILHQEEIKELKNVIRGNNRKIKKQDQQLKNYRSDKKLVHLEEVTKNQSIKIGEYIRVINQYELEKL